MLTIRLSRAGAKRKTSHRVVVIDREKARDGRFIEILGHYDPRRNPPEVVLDRERISYWLSQGARPSETVRSLIKKTPLAEGQITS